MQWNVCGNVRDEYTKCGGYTIVQCGRNFFMMFDWTVKVITVWGWQKVRFLEVLVVTGLKPLELTQCLRPKSDLVQDGGLKMFIVELITITMQVEGKVGRVVSQQLVV